MSEAHKPDGYPDVSPYLILDNAPAALEFARRVFGAEELRRFDMPDGTILHAEVRIGDSVLMIGEAGGEWRPVPGHLHVYVPDVDAAYRKALDAGAASLQEPQRREGDSDRRGGVKDPAGNTWWIATLER